MDFLKRQNSIEKNKSKMDFSQHKQEDNIIEAFNSGKNSYEYKFTTSGNYSEDVIHRNICRRWNKFEEVEKAYPSFSKPIFTSTNAKCNIIFKDEYQLKQQHDEDIEYEERKKDLCYGRIGGDCHRD